MDRIRTLYNTVERKLAGLDFGQLWPGFRPCGFALYTEEWVYLHSRVLPNDGSFRGNTAIRFESGYLAIWQVTAEDYENENILAANLVHEMFHVFQMEQGESRFPDDLAALGEPMEADLLSMKLTENRLLAQALRLEDTEARRTALTGFCALREERRRRLNHLPELLPETAEGMAEYVGVRALENLDGEAFRWRIAACLRRLETAGPLQLDTRRLAYDSGLTLLLSAGAAGLELFHSPGQESRPIYELLLPQLPRIAPPPVTPDETLEALRQQDLQSRRDTLRRFFRQAEPPVSGRFAIRGYDPMNMFRLGGLLYGSHFWSLRDLDREADVQLTGEAVLRFAVGRETSGYWIRKGDGA